MFSKSGGSIFFARAVIFTNEGEIMLTRVELGLGPVRERDDFQAKINE